MKEEIDKTHNDELDVNKSGLMSKLRNLDKEFINCLNSQSIIELRDRSLDISEKIKTIFKEVETIDIPQEIKELLINEKICFNALSDALTFKKVDLRKLESTKAVFKKWNFETLNAIDSIDDFIRVLAKYNNLKEIPKEKECLLLLILNQSILDNTSPKMIFEEFKNKSLPSEQIVQEKEKKPNVIPIHLSVQDTSKEWVKLCLVQLNFSINGKFPPKNEFGYVLDEKDKIKNKVLTAIEIAKEEKVEIICFPELSFDKEWIEEIEKNCGEMIIIGGSYYDGGYNICPIITEKDTFFYRKCDPSPFENPSTFGIGMKRGDALFVFQTKFGKFSVLTCSDFNPDLVPLIRPKEQNIDFIFCPSCETTPFILQEFMNSVCNHYETGIIHANKAPETDSYGKSCIINKEHEIYLKRSKDYGFKPQKDPIRYKILELGKERMVIADLNLKRKSPSLGTPSYCGGIRVSSDNCYEYDDKKEKWFKLVSLPLYE